MAKTNNTVALKASMSRVLVAPGINLPCYDIPKPLMRALRSMTKKYNKPCIATMQYLQKIETLRDTLELEVSSYCRVLDLLLFLEEYQNNVDMEQYMLHKCSITLVTNRFKIMVPGLQEDRPSLMANDIVYIRDISKEKKNNCIAIIIYVGDNFIFVRTSKKFLQSYNDKQRFNIKFKWPNWPMRCCHFAISLAEENCIAPILYPQETVANNKPKVISTWINKDIESNPEQAQAITNILGKTSCPNPYVLFGPPGTGKTATLIEAIVQIRLTQPVDRVLVCTPSNAAADVIAKRLLEHIPAEDIYRIYSPSKEWEDVEDVLVPCSNFEERTEKAFLKIAERNIIVTTLVTCTRLLSRSVSNRHFAYVFIDEAGQATEPETLIPFTLLGQEYYCKANLQGQVILAGDPKQLGPSLRSELATPLLGKSMLERIMECPPYQKNQDNKYNATHITKLIRNYRSNEIILKIPNSLFYEDELIACGGKHVNSATNWMALPNKKVPIIFHDVRGLEEKEHSSPSCCNMEEVRIVLWYASMLMKTKFGGKKLQPEDIAVITPFRLQRSKIRVCLDRKKYEKIDVGTVETFQGQERPVIIVSTVRSKVFTDGDKRHIGFLSNPKRFNVAVTRAKSLLIVVGNADVLRLDNCWNTLIKFCKKNKAIRFGNTPVLQTSSKVATKNEQDRNRKHKNGQMTAKEQEEKIERDKKKEKKEKNKQKKKEKKEKKEQRKKDRNEKKKNEKLSSSSQLPPMSSLQRNDILLSPKPNVNESTSTDSKTDGNLSTCAEWFLHLCHSLQNVEIASDDEDDENDDNDGNKENEVVNN